MDTLNELWDNVPASELPKPDANDVKFRSICQNGKARGESPEKWAKTFSEYSRYYYARVNGVIMDVE